MNKAIKSLPLSSKAVLWLLGSLLIASLPGWLIFPSAIMLFSLAMIAWRFLNLYYNWRPLPNWLKPLLVIIAMATLYLTYGQLYGRRIAAAMLLLMMSLKAVELHNRRDARVLASLGVFLATTYFLFLQNPTMLVYGLTIVVLLLQSLNVLQLEFIPTTATADQRPSLLRQVPEIPGISGLISSLRIILYALPLGIVLFIVFPRLATPLWGVPEAALDGKSGLSDEMSPGSIQNLFMDDSPAFRVEFLTRRPPNSELYWRGPVLWNFDGRRWSTLYRGYRIIPPEQLPAVTTEQSIRYRVQLEPSERRWLYALDYVVEKPADSRLTRGYQLYAKQPVTNPRTYSITSEPAFIDIPELSGAYRKMALDLPAGYNPEASDWVRQLRLQYPVQQRSYNTENDILLIKSVLEYFNQEEFYYSLNPPLLGHHSVDEFLFDTRSGFCEHYASTFTVLMRMAGIPARVVTGYQGGYYNQAGEYLLVRQSDAHAWAEVWLDGKGWLRVDPTSQVAPERILSGAMDVFSNPRNWHDFTWLRELRNNLDLIQHFWNNWVMDFSAYSQSQILKNLGLGKLGKRWIALIILLPIFLTIAATTLFLLKYRSIRSRNPAVRAYRSYLKQLEKAGFKFSISDDASTVAHKVSEKLNNKQSIAAAWLVAESVNKYFYSKQAISIKAFETLVKGSLSKILRDKG